MVAPTTRRGLLRSGATAIGGAVSFGSATDTDGRGDARSGDFECDGVDLRDGYVFFRDRYRACARFHLAAELRAFRTSVGRGRSVCRNDALDYVAYLIRYDDGDVTILAVQHPDPEESPSLYEYYLPGIPFRFTRSKGHFAFQSGCSEPPTPVRRVEFARVV